MLLDSTVEQVRVAREAEGHVTMAVLRTEIHTHSEAVMVDTLDINISRSEDALNDDIQFVRIWLCSFK